MSDEERASSGESDVSSDGLLVDEDGYDENDDYVGMEDHGHRPMQIRYNLGVLDPDLFILPALQLLFMIAVVYNEHEVATCHAVQRLGYLVHPIAVAFFLLLVSRLGLRIVYIELSGSRFRFHAVREQRGRRFITVKSHLRVYEGLLVCGFIVGLLMLLVLWFIVPSKRTRATLESGQRCEDSAAHYTCVCATLFILVLCIAEAVFIGRRRRDEQAELEEKARRALQLYHARDATATEAHERYEALVAARSSRLGKSVAHKRRALVLMRANEEEEARSASRLLSAVLEDAPRETELDDGGVGTSKFD